MTVPDPHLREVNSRVLLERDEAVAIVTLNRPHARNAVDLDLCHDLLDAFKQIEHDADIRAVLIRGAGTVFCAGADMKERRDRDEEWVRRRRVASFAAYRAIERCTRPVLSVVHGSVVGSGGEIMMAGDFAYAAEGTTFRFPEVQWGTIGATQRLQRIIGRRKAKELLFTGDRLGDDEAFRLGLIQRVLPADTAFEVALATARRMAEAPPLATSLTKRAVDRGSEVTLDQGIEVEMWAIEQNLAAGSWRAGLSQFEDSETVRGDTAERTLST